MECINCPLNFHNSAVHADTLVEIALYLSHVSERRSIIGIIVHLPRINTVDSRETIGAKEYLRRLSPIRTDLNHNHWLGGRKRFY